jgi:uncharacterized protein YneF (UPF0154 family)
MVEFLISIKPLLIGAAYAVGIAGGSWIYDKLTEKPPQ